jgi:tRNA splicing ligase
VQEGAEGGETEEEMRIVGRGYDKFFNLDEVEYTTVCSG